MKGLFPTSLLYQDLRKSNKPSRNGKTEVSSSKIFQVTVGTQFKEALDTLTQKIWKTTPYFIRCIKPNSIKRPKIFDNKEVSGQLNCGGVYEVFFFF